MKQNSTEKDINCMILLIYGIKKPQNLLKQRVEWCLPGTGGAGVRELGNSISGYKLATGR